MGDKDEENKFIWKEMNMGSTACSNETTMKMLCDTPIARDEKRGEERERERDESMTRFGKID